MKDENNKDWSSLFIAKMCIAVPFGIIGGIEMHAGVIGTIVIVGILYFVCTLFTE